MKTRGLYLFCLILFITKISLGDASGMRQLSNSVVKSIKSQDGDVIDCVDIYHQPAFDHPLLKNHTIKMKPSSLPEGQFIQKNLSNFESNEITQLWQLSGKCPEGTIPITRTEKTANHIKKQHRNTPPAVSSLRHEYAYTATGQGNYYGAKAIISAWRPFVERREEFSLSQLWLVGGSGANRNTIEVGWIVNPEVFGDYRTRLFVYWTRDNYGRTGCYNLRCSGFVQITNKMAIGSAISLTGKHPETSLLVWKDVKQRVWWLQYNGRVIGYWPTSIFTFLKGSASLVEWGGEIINSRVNGRHTATNMGSGSFAQAGFGRASYFRNLQVVDNKNTLRPPARIGGFATNSKCYNILVGNNNVWGNYFYYGGPGRNPKCP